jgi:hypothetical protein
VAVKNMGQCGNPSFYERFLNLYFNNYESYLSRSGGSLRRIWINAMWDVRRSAGCTAWRKLRDTRRGGSARRRARYRSRDARRGTERGHGAERRGARGRQFPRWKDRLPGCDAGHGTRRGVGSPVKGLPSGGLVMRGRRERGT